MAMAQDTWSNWTLSLLPFGAFLSACATHDPRSVAAADSCPSTPVLVRSEQFTDANDAYSLNAAAMRRTQANFATAFRRACGNGLLRGWPYLAARAAHDDRIFLKDTANLTGVLLWLDGEEGAPSTDRRILLEFPFVSANGAVHVPTVRQFSHAILCGVEARYGLNGSHPPFEDILECLP
jgi:hypothetical protein